LSSGAVTCLKCGYPLTPEREDARRLLCTECGTGHNLELEGADGKRGARWLTRRVLMGIWSCRDIRRVLAGEEQDFKPGGAWSIRRLTGLLILSYVLAGAIPTLANGVWDFRRWSFESYNVSILDIAWIAGAVMRAVDWAAIGIVAGAWWLVMTIALWTRGFGITRIASVSVASLVLVPWIFALPVGVALIIAGTTMSQWGSPWEGLLELCLRFAVLICTAAWISWWWFGAIHERADVRRVLYAIAIGLTVAWTMYSLYPYEN
jgi:hypothetical protein